MKQKEIDDRLLELLNKYHHYKFMKAGFFQSLTLNVGMSFYDFIKWLESREN